MEEGLQRILAELLKCKNEQEIMANVETHLSEQSQKQLLDAWKFIDIIDDNAQSLAAAQAAGESRSTWLRRRIEELKWYQKTKED